MGIGEERYKVYRISHYNNYAPYVVVLRYTRTYERFLPQRKTYSTPRKLSGSTLTIFRMQAIANQPFMNLYSSSADWMLRVRCCCEVVSRECTTSVYTIHYRTIGENYSSTVGDNWYG